MLSSREWPAGRRAGKLGGEFKSVNGTAIRKACWREPLAATGRGLGGRDVASVRERGCFGAGAE